MSPSKPLTLHSLLFASTLMVGALGLPACAGAEAEGRVGVTTTVASVDDFTGVLAPYGTWLTLPGYREVWQPSAAVVGLDFMPYTTAGSWISTDAGWYFASDWSWGWAPFHYGEWLDDPIYGWVWIPGLTWGPAWVDWSIGGGYIGWVPRGPHHGHGGDAHHWRFVTAARFTEPHVSAVALRPERMSVAVRERMQPVVTDPRPGHYSAGPPVEYVQRAGGRPLETMHVDASWRARPHQAALSEPSARPVPGERRPAIEGRPMGPRHPGRR
jgi:hypothetical protein